MQNIDTTQKTILNSHSAVVLKKTYIRNNARWWMGVSLALGDLLSIMLSGFLAVGFWRLLRPDLRVDLYIQVLAPLFVLIYLGIFAFRGLYPAIGLSPVQELRRLDTPLLQ